MTQIEFPTESYAPVPLSTKAAATLRRHEHRIGASTIVAIVMLLGVVVLVGIPPFLSSYDPYTQNLSDALQAPFAGGKNLLGTDPLGRDILSRLSLGAQTSLLVAVSAVAINFVLGVILGLVSGYFGRIADTVIMFVANLQLAIPIVLLLIAILAVIKPSTQMLVVILGFTFWVGHARVARAITKSLRDRDFIMAPMTQGATAFWILRKHILPNVVPQLVIIISFDIGAMITIEASLGYLGLGVQPPTPSLGAMISESQSYLQTNPWLCLLPGAVIFLLIAGTQILSQHITAEGSGAIGPVTQRKAR
jgi:peptide/nickel transport system permease protein